MKTIKFFLLLALISAWFLSGCKKSEVAPIPPSANQNLNDLKAAEAFNWSTGQTVKLQITGLPTLIPVKNTLKVTLQDGTEVFTRFHQMDKDLSVNLIIPSTEKQAVIKYGSVSYPVNITNGEINFSFIPNIQD